MAAYVIADLGNVESALHIARLDRSGAGRFGERMIVDSGRCDTLAGDWTPERMVVLEFPTREQAQSWWDARILSAPPEVRDVKRNMILVDGL